MSKNIVFVTNLPTWSMNSRSGGPAFYKTIDYYYKKNWNITLYTTESTTKPDLNQFPEIKVYKLPKLRFFNIRHISSFSGMINYIINQFVFLIPFLFKKKKYDIIYAYEIEFVPAAFVISKLFRIPLVSRFQGTILYPKLNKIFETLKFLNHFLSLKIPANLTIMTDDGTKGDKVIKYIRGHTNNLLFIKNGVDLAAFSENNLSSDIINIAQEMKNYKFNFISVSRLVRWKRVDRSIDIFNKFYKHNKNSRYIIAGDGDKKLDLINKVTQLESMDNILFTGSINKDEVDFLLSRSNIFLSTYELSNVGNPLYEAMKNRCLVVTVANGDTSKIIQDNYTGIISNEEKYIDNANKLILLVNDEKKFNEIINRANEKLFTIIQSWEKRMDKEFELVGGLK